MRSPALISSGVSRNSRIGVCVLSPITSACCPDGWIVTGTRLLESVSSRTRDVRLPTPEIRPTTPRPSIVAQTVEDAVARAHVQKDGPAEGGCPNPPSLSRSRRSVPDRAAPRLRSSQAGGVLLLQLQRGLAPGPHLLQLSAQFLILFVKPGVALENRPPSGPVPVTGAMAHSMFGTTRSTTAARRTLHAGIVDAPDQHEARPATTPVPSPADAGRGGCGSHHTGPVPCRSFRQAASGRSRVSAVVIYRMAEEFFILQRLAGADGHAVQAFVGHRNGQPRLLAAAPRRGRQAARRRPVSMTPRSTISRQGRAVSPRARPSPPRRSSATGSASASATWAWLIFGFLGYTVQQVAAPECASRRRAPSSGMRAVPIEVFDPLGRRFPDQKVMLPPQVAD